MTAASVSTFDRWTQHGHTLARGQTHLAGRLLRAGDIAALFDPLDPSQWAATAAAMNGSFAVLRRSDDEIAAAVDRLRSIPLFYADAPQGLKIAHDALQLRSELPPLQLDPTSAQEFRLTGYVTGNRTLFDGLFQIPAGHVLTYSRRDRSPTLTRYHAYRHGNFFTDDDAALTEELARVHERVFKRLVADTDGRQLVVPLSGGYDSRLIGVMLRDLGQRDVLCYTYGTAGNWEARISQELARHLGFRWTMIPYSAERWREWAALPEFERYFSRAGQFCSSPHFQDWPAVRELTRSGQVEPGAVFVPGHTGDFLTGGHIPKIFPRLDKLSPAEVVQAILDSHFKLWDWPADHEEYLRRAFTARIEEFTGPLRECSPEEAADVFEMWEFAERQSKFIVNSVRVYEDFGHEWRLPLFDAELIDFWSRVPIAGRVGRRLYFAYVDRFQKLPVTRANTDRIAPAAAVIEWINRSRLRPLAKRAQRVVRRARWRREYEGGTVGWFALVAPEEFRAHYTGREIAHSFFAARYLEQLSR